MLPLLLAVRAFAASVPLGLQSGDAVSAQCHGDQLTIESPTATAATLTCAADSPFAGIDATGTTDVTAPLNAVLAALPNGTVAGFPPNGRYRIEGTLLLSQKDGVTIDGHRSTFFATTNGSGTASQVRRRAHWRFSRCTNLTVRDMVIVGASTSTGPHGIYNAALEAQHGLEIAGSQHVLVEDVDVSGVWGDLVNVAKFGSNPAVPSSHVTVQDSILVGSSRQGVSVTNADHVTFQNNTIDRARRSLIDLETNGVNDRLTFISILNNRLGSARFATIANWGPASDVHDLLVDGNQFTGGAQYPFRITIKAPDPSRRANVTITNNVGHAARRQNEPFAFFANIDAVIVSGNTATFVPGSWPTRTGRFGSPQGAVMLICSTGVVARNTWTKNPAIEDLVERCPERRAPPHRFPLP
jgi:hypothetical protein